MDGHGTTLADDPAGFVIIVGIVGVGALYVIDSQWFGLGVLAILLIVTLRQMDLVATPVQYADGDEAGEDAAES